MASLAGFADILETLIEAGGDVNFPDKHGTTPLGKANYKKQEAVDKNKEDVVKKQEAVVTILKKAGATSTYKEPLQTDNQQPTGSSFGFSEEFTNYVNRGGKKKSKRNKTKSKSKTKRNKRKTK